MSSRLSRKVGGKGSAAIVVAMSFARERGGLVSAGGVVVRFGNLVVTDRVGGLARPLMGLRSPYVVVAGSTHRPRRQSGWRRLLRLVPVARIPAARALGYGVD